MERNTKAQLFGALLVAATTCWFVILIADRWITHTLPTNAFVLLMLGGLAVVGAILGFTTCAIANLIFRFGPPKLRVPLSAMVWLASNSIWFALSEGPDTDPHRKLVVLAIVAASGLLVGPFNAELIVGNWYLKRLATRQSSSS